MGSHFVGGYRLDFSPTEQETKTSIMQAFSPRYGPRLLQKKQNKNLLNLSIIDRNAFYKDMLRKASDQHIHQK